MKKLRSLVAAVVAVACLYTPTAAADPLSVELNALDSTIQVDGMAGNQPDGDAADGDQPDDNGVVESDGGALTSGSGETTVESEGADTVPEGADATPGEGDGAADDGPTADTPQAVDWTNAVDNLRLSTQGLTITPSVPADGETDADIAGTSVIPEGLNGSGVSRGAALGGLAESQPEQQAKEGAAQLPDAIDATLNLTFTLDAAAGDGRTDGSGLGTIVAGDHFSVPMPEGLATADEGSALDVFARDTDGNTTTVRVAEAKASDGVLTVTFTEPADAQAREAVTASIDVPVTLDAALVQDEVSTIEWTVRTMEDAEGNRQPETLTLNVPAKADVMKMLGLAGTQDPESEENGGAADKTDEASDETKKSQTAPNAAEPLADNVLQPETTYVLSDNKSVQLEVTWCDNNYGSRPTVDSLTNGYNPQFSFGDGKWTHLFDESGAISQDARASLHLGADETPSWATRTVRQTSVNTYIASASNLPTKLTSTTRVPVDANGDGVQDEDELGNLVWETKESSEQTITWLMDDTNTYPDKYQFGDNDDVHGEKGDPHRYLMLTSEVTFTVEGKIGDEKLSTIFREGQKEFFQFGATIDNKDQGSGALADVAEQEHLTITDKGANATITGRLPMYHENGDPIVYYITYTGPSPELEDSDYIDGTDYFQVSYNNSASANHGSATDAMYEGGTMVLRRMGTTDYTATKAWLDGGNKENRPATTFTLWRYANNGTAGATTASQVQLNEVTTGTGEAQPNAIGYVSVEVPAQSGDSENSVDLGDLLIQKYGEGIRNLPKYDPDGYPYVYALREEGAPAGYEIVYGSVGQDGKVADKAPNYEKADCTNPDPGREEPEDATRPSNDPLVYNGGTITNRLTGTKKVSVTKTWEIAAFQDDLKNVEITFKAQSRVMGKYADDNTGWADVTGEHATHTEGGWKSETLTRTFSETFPKYNVFGEELEYRWVESGVKQGDKEIEFTPDEKGGGSFTLTLPTPDDEGTETLRFTSTFEAAKDEDGTDTITNTFENTTTEYVEKWWQQPDGSMKQVKPDPNGYPEYPDLDLSGEVTFGVYRDGELVGTFTMDGTSAKQASPLYKDGDDEVAEGFENATWQETASYDVTLDGLPKYSPEGKRYSYVVLEDPVDGWHTDRVYDAEKHLTKVENTVGPGEGSEIRVMKNWIDGDDAAHRQPVVVQLVVTDEDGIRSEATNDDGTPKYEYAYGETVTAVSQDNQSTENGQIILSADNSWFAEVEIPIGRLSYTQFKLVEVGLLQDDGTINPVVDSPAQAAEEYGADIVWGNVGWDYDDTENTSRVANEHHVYETSAGADDEPQHNDAMRAVTASNRRIGLLDLTVTKLWQDGGDAENRPDARIELSCTEYADAFSIDDTGYVWVQVSDNRLPVNIPTGPNANDRRQLNTTEDKVSLDKKTGNLVMEIDSSAAGTEGTYHFFGLPKYDAQSAVVHYDVNEQWVGDHEGYASSKTTGEYVVGTQHFHDTQEFDFTNTRTGTRDVTFYKHWNDQYVNDQLKQRPDVYLTLYRVTVTGVDNEGNETYSDPVAVDGYVRWLWEPTDTDNPQYEQKATVQSLPAYDGEGREYVYYASESMAVEDTASLDYAPVTFSYASLDDARLTAEQAGESYPGGSNAVWIGDGTMQGDPLSDGTNFAIHEDGTFVNALTGNLTATGTKLWMNVPGNVVQGADGNDLPGITIYLQRKLASDAEWPDLYFAVDENGSWSFKGERGAVAWTSHLVYQTNNQYSYTLMHVGENGADPTNEDGELLARYDANGEQYQYRAIEVPWGMCNQPGGFDPTDIDGKAIDAVNFADLHDSEIDQLGVIVIAHGETGSFRITNVYDSPKGSLTVKKLFSGREAGDRYPSTTFDVHRYYVNGQGQKSDAALVDTVTLTNKHLSKPTTDDENANPKVTGGDSAGNNTAEYTFSGLDIYAPDGSYWQYYVVERNIDGYTTTVGVGDLEASAVTGAGTSRENPATGTSSPDLCKGGEATAGDDGAQTYAPITDTVLVEDTVNDDGAVTSNDDTVDVTFKNTYVPGDTDLKGTKTWTDYSNIFGARPSVEEFINGLTITRSAGGVTEMLSADDGTAAELKLVVKSEDVTTEEEKENTTNLLTYSESDNVFSFTLYNVEQYAPNGVAWTYEVEENEEDFPDYSVVTGPTSSVRADTSNTFKLENAPRGKATVEKSWVDENGDPADDPYGLRPTSVTMRLQARVTLAESEGSQPGEWDDAYTVLQQFASAKNIDAEFEGGSNHFEKTLTSNSGWRATWTRLPVVARAPQTDDDALVDNKLYNIEYRAVEIKIGDQDISKAVNTSDDNVYDDGVNPYQPKQESWTGGAQDGWTTQVSNALDDTSISATKTWTGDEGDQWDSRPENTTSNNWKVTFYLQRSTDVGANWEWVVEAGANPATSPRDPGVVNLTITGNDTDESQTVTWDSLPQYDQNNSLCLYRVVEEVPGGYDVNGGSEVAEITDDKIGVTYRYYVVNSTDSNPDDGTDAKDAQSFTNTLRTVTLKGTKAWVDWDGDDSNNPAFDASKTPKLTLYRAIQTGTDESAGTATWSEPEKVMQNGSPAQQPEWSDSNSDGVWEFTYTGLPAANENDQPYVYWAEEQIGTDGVGGYYPLYQYGDTGQSGDSHDAAGTTVDTEASAGTIGEQINEPITNVATKLALDKVSNWLVENGGQNDWEQLANIELSIQSRDGNTTYAVWTNGANGETYNTYTWIGGTDDPKNTSNAVQRTDNLIVGLKKGDYKLVETGVVPEGYAIAPEVYFEIKSDGTATFEGVYLNDKRLDTSTDPVTSGSDVVMAPPDKGVQTINLTAQDPVLRGHLQLTKYVSDNGKVGGEHRAPLEGATFDLYVQDVDGDGKDELIASGLTSAKGVVTTVGSDVKMNTWSSKGYDADGNVVADPETSGAKDLTHGGKYGQLRDGLPEGTYYFVETDATTGAVMPSGDGVKSGELKITQDNHFAYTNAAVSQTMENEDFSATVTLHKFDAEANNAPIQNATFTVRYTPEDGSYTTLPSSWTETTDANGVLTLDGLEKGTYTVEETSNEGYVNNGFTATFTIDDADDDKTYDITTTDRKDAAVKAIDFQVTSGDGTFVDGQGIPNVPERGSVTIEKVSSASATTKLNGVTFELQKMNGSDWTTVKPTVVAAGLVTDRSYAMNDDNSALVNAAGTEITDSDGRITVSNLKWGTYRFVETAFKDGYVGITDKGSAVTSGDLTIGRTSLNPSQTGARAVTNTPVSLELNKQNQAGEALDGAVFTVTPMNGSKFADTAALGNAYDAETGAVRLTTSNGGHATLTAQLVVGGTYEIYEVQGPTGYNPVDAKFQVTVKNDGSLEVVDGDIVLENTGWSRADANGDGQADNAFSFTAVNNHMAVKLVKVSSSNPDLTLEGVTFRLTGQVMSDNDTTHTYTTNKDGAIYIDAGLMSGVDYTLTEDTTHPGYIRHTEPLKFRMNVRGEIEIIGNAPEGWSVNADKISFTVENDSVDLQITKHDPDRNPLFGAVFRVTPVNGSTTFADGSTKPQELRTGMDGTLFMGAKLMVGGTYDITEVSAPEGYEKVPGIMRVTVGKDGAINVVGSVDENGNELSETEPTGYDKVDTNAFEVQVVNQPVEITIDKVSAADGGTHLDGAVFEVTGVFADEQDEETREYTTASDGTLVGISNISAELKSGQTYTLREKTAPAGYELIDGTLTFAVAEDGTVSAEGDVPTGYSISTDKVSIVASDEPIEVLFEKRGLTDDGDLLPGSEFTISGTFVNDATHETSQQEIPFTTGSDATVIGKLPHDGATYSLVAGQTYTVTENTAPAGYEKLSAFSFTVDEHGVITAADGSTTAGAGEPGYAISTKGGTVTLTAHDRPIEVTLAKTGSDADGALLDGAVFELSRIEQTADGEVLDSLGEVKSESNGAVSLAGLVTGGTYVLHEKTAPEGYELMNDVRFTVAEDGTVALVNAPEGWTLVNGEDGVSALTASDAPIEARLVKTDGTGAPLIGAGFEIKPQDGSRFAGSPALNDDGALEVGPSGEDGIVQIPVGVLVAGGTYELVEVTAPAGYELAGTARFTVHADGTISIKDATDGEPFGPTDGSGAYTASADGGTAVITAQDAPIEIELKKRAEGKNGKALAGAVFKVTPADDSSFVDDSRNDSGITLTASAADGTVDTAALDAQLIAGNSYVIEEVTPPAGYEKIVGALTFTVNDDGTIAETAGDANDSAFDIDATDDAVTITAADRPVEVTLNKVSSADPETKLDATFTLTGVFAADIMDGTAEAAKSTRPIGVTAGTATLDRLIVGNTYVLQETKSQAGYEVITGTLTFTVNADGTVTAMTADGNGAAIANDPAFGTVQDTERITATNTPVRISVAKVDEDNKPLEGAEFTLTGDMANADGTIESNHTWTVKPGTDSAAVEGLIVTNGTDRHEYTLTESAAPAGYESLGSITFTINPDGTITGEGAGYTVDGSGVTITAQDTAIKARLRKTDENGQPQAGATFEIQATLGGTFSDGNTSKQFTTGADGFVDLDEHWFVGGNSYVITEVTAPGGYELAGAATFTVNKDGTITFHDDADRPTQAIVHGRGGSGTYQASSTADGVAVITASNSPIAVQLTKVSGTTPLAGATFELTPVPGSTFADGTVETQSITFTSAGVTALTNLRADATYTLKETVPPAGYELNTTEFTFTVAKDGTITPTEAAGYTVTGDEIVTITANDEPIEVTLTKQNADGAALDGAEFTLHGMFANADGTPSGTVADRTVVVENGTVALEGLIADQQYTLTETKAPEGYRVNTGTLTFTVNTGGTLTEVELAESYAIDADTATAITVIDQPTELDLIKLASDGTPLAGAEFTLAPDTEHDADSRFVSDRSSIDLVVGEDGTVPTVTGELIAGHAYVLTETKAPDGYALITESLHFTVGRKGRAASVTAGTELPKGYTIGGNKEAGTIALTAVDQPIELTLKKVNEGGDALVGAEFTLSGRFADGTTQQILTTGADGTVALPLIIGGERYVLEETKAPEGYVLPAERYTFTVGVDGVIRVQQNLLAALLPGDKTFSLSQDGLTITVVNEREPVVAITGSDVTSVGFIGFGLLLIGATIAMQRRTRMAQVVGNGKPARGRHRR